MPSVRLTDSQTKAVASLLDAFIAQEGRLSAINPMLPIQLKVVKAMVDNDELFDQHEFDLLINLMEIYFEAVDEDEEIWPSLEQAYAKLKGHWPHDIPPYDRVLYNGHLVGYYGNHKPPLGQ